jgi:hypothetical protein
MGFVSTSDAISLIQEGQTDADSGVNELLMSVFRKNYEQMLIRTYYTGVSGTLTSDPSGAGVCTDTGASFTVDAHIGQTVIFVDGAAAGNMYAIDDNDATTFTLTGDDPAADGVLSGDTYMFFFDLINYTEGHKHDGLNGQNFVPFRNSIASGQGGYTGYGSALFSIVDTTNRVVGSTYVYIPDGSETMRMASGLYLQNSGFGLATMHFSISGVGTSSNNQTTAVSPTWINSANLDVSSATPGHHQVSLIMNSGHGSTNAYCMGYNLYIE